VRSDDGCPIEAVKTSHPGGNGVFMDLWPLGEDTSGAGAYERD
jgi:hypothetical protein